MRIRKLFGIAVLAAGFLAGCGGASKTAATEPAMLTAPDAAAAMAAAQTTLSRMQFVMDKYDIEAGYLRTRPLRAGQFFEPWRQDNASARAFGQANIDSLRRTVEVFVEPQGQAVQWRCVVMVERLSIPPRPIRGMSQIAGMYTDSSRMQQTLTLEDKQGAAIEWLPLGRDAELEARIVKRIQKQLNS